MTAEALRANFGSPSRAKSSNANYLVVFEKWRRQFSRALPFTLSTAFSPMPDGDKTSANAEWPAIDPDVAEQFASAFVPSWRFDEASFSAGSADPPPTNPDDALEAPVFPLTVKRVAAPRAFDDEEVVRRPSTDLLLGIGAGLATVAVLLTVAVHRMESPSSEPIDAVRTSRLTSTPESLPIPPPPSPPDPTGIASAIPPAVRAAPPPTHTSPSTKSTVEPDHAKSTPKPESTGATLAPDFGI